jgi:hypothetical protein
MIPEQTLLGFPLFGDNATKVEPDNNKKSNGWQQGDVVPAEWMNWEWYHASKGVADLNKGVSSMEKEINAVLASFGITAAEATNNQLLTAMRLNASFVTATGTTITGPLLVSGGTIRVMFTAAIAGNDTTTGLTISYNGQSIAVKVYKEGNLENFTAAKISWQDTNVVHRYLDAGTTLELLYDGTQFIIVNNPIVLKSIRYTIYADGTVGGGNIFSIKPSFTETTDYGWLPGEHQSLLRADYPKAVNYMQTHFITANGETKTMLEFFGYEDANHFYLPDTRESALVGAGQNASDSIATHDVYTVGEFKDDCMQEHKHPIAYSGDASVGLGNHWTMHQTQNQAGTLNSYSNNGRSGSVTRGKRKGVIYIIKVL